MEETTEMQRLLTVHEVAEVLGTADGFVRQLVAARRIRFLRVGKHLRFPVSAVPEYLAAVTVEPLPSRGRSA
ncbi:MULTISPECIES: excisionase family DNA-binding protein [Intrasporangiaceae]|jgi:excisionase family DNA binding protein|uniref:excisionase family DNA-binding protein n=1 Tax=Intrasporangiaceae TaxID=85021 RepID=UPI000A62D04A|nr:MULTISPECIES: excisionase family DNA-binding protein [Intrasporangiaceae]